MGPPGPKRIAQNGGRSGLKEKAPEGTEGLEGFGSFEILRKEALVKGGWGGGRPCLFIFNYFKNIFFLKKILIFHYVLIVF